MEHRQACVVLGSTVVAHLILDEVTGLQERAKVFVAHCNAGLEPKTPVTERQEDQTALDSNSRLDFRTPIPGMRGAALDRANVVPKASRILAALRATVFQPLVQEAQARFEAEVSAGGLKRQLENDDVAQFASGPERGCQCTAGLGGLMDGCVQQ